MTGAALAEIVDFYRVDASTKLDSAKRALLGQFMTPAPIARFMASLFSETRGDIRVLDPGAGVGSLTAALADRLCAVALRPRSVEFVCYEVDQMLSGYLRDTLDQAETQCRGVGIDANGRFVEKDFILCDGLDRQADLFDGSGQADADFSHAILNPPYRKINAGSEHRAHRAFAHTRMLPGAGVCHDQHQPCAAALSACSDVWLPPDSSGSMGRAPRTVTVMMVERLEGSLWAAADNLRANSKLTSSEYCMPVLGVINHFGSIRSFDAGIRRDDCAL